MKTFSISDDRGSPYAFEIPLVYVSSSSLRRILSRVDGVSHIRRPSRASRREGARWEFECGGEEYVVWEPYGDNSRYWIGPRGDAVEPHPRHIAVIERAFREHKPSLARKLIGDILSLNLKGLFKAE